MGVGETCLGHAAVLWAQGNSEKRFRTRSSQAALQTGRRRVSSIAASVTQITFQPGAEGLGMEVKWSWVILAKCLRREINCSQEHFLLSFTCTPTADPLTPQDAFLLHTCYCHCDDPRTGVWELMRLRHFQGRDLTLKWGSKQRP